MHNPLRLVVTKLLKTKEVMGALSVSESTVYRLVRAGTLPAPIKLGPQCNRWREADIEVALDALRPSPTAA